MIRLPQMTILLAAISFLFSGCAAEQSAAPPIFRAPAISNSAPVSLPRAGAIVTNAAAAIHSTTNDAVPYAPGTLGYLIWTNFTAHTNGKSTQMWSTYILPTNFPVSYLDPTNLPANTKPILAWNTNCLLWGMKGQTAISQCQTAQSARGQGTLTLLTRRHGYVRGHGSGPPGMNSRGKGHRVYFCTKDNRVVEALVEKVIVEVGSGYDFTIALFSEDLPPGIEPMRVVDQKTLFEKYPPGPAGKWIVFLTEQTGHVSANCPPFIVNTWKGGDSGSPDMLPMPGELVFYRGRSTSGPSRKMQDAMDELSRSAGLDPVKYQMLWVDLSSFPTPAAPR